MRYARRACWSVVSGGSTRFGATAAVVYQRPSGGKKNEIGTIPATAGHSGYQRGVRTLDAMHCQKETMKRLHKEVQAFFHKTRRDEPQRIEQGRYEELGKGHGRIEQRCHVRLAVTDWLESARGREGLAGVVEVTRKGYIGNREREERSCCIT